MPKIAKYFQFAFPLNKRTISKGLRLQIIHLGDLIITGKAYLDPSVSAINLEDPRYSVEITSILWNNAEVSDLLLANQMDTIMVDIEEAAIQHASTLFTSNVAA
jgi:hypothetical protein